MADDHILAKNINRELSKWKQYYDSIKHNDTDQPCLLRTHTVAKIKPHDARYEGTYVTGCVGARNILLIHDHKQKNRELEPWQRYSISDDAQSIYDLVKNKEERSTSDAMCVDECGDVNMDVHSALASNDSVRASNDSVRASNDSVRAEYITCPVSCEEISIYDCTIATCCWNGFNRDAYLAMRQRKMCCPLCRGELTHQYITVNVRDKQDYYQPSVYYQIKIGVDLSWAISRVINIISDRTQRVCCRAAVGRVSLFDIPESIHYNGSKTLRELNLHSGSSMDVWVRAHYDISPKVY